MTIINKIKHRLYFMKHILKNKQTKNKEKATRKRENFLLKKIFVKKSRMKSLILMGEQDNQACISNEDEAEKIFRLKKNGSQRS